MKQKTRRRLQNIGVALLILAGFAWIAFKFIGFTSSTYTDNAQVYQRLVPVNSRVQGFITEVRFDDYTPVHKGDTLALIEDADFRLQLAQAEANLQNALAGKDVTSTSVSAANNDVSVTEAAIAEVEARLKDAGRNLERYRTLLSQEAVTQQQFDAVETEYLALKARRDMLQRQQSSTGLVARQQSQRVNQNEAGIAAAEAAVNLARLNLSYTVILAPCDGYASRRNVQPGQLVQPGQTLLTIVDTADTWVIANYRETQIARMAVGDKVRIEVDAVPGVTFAGEIATISNATGAKYAPMPQDNSTGNFVKVEQRIPVKILFSADTPSDEMARLRSGMNVECTVEEE